MFSLVLSAAALASVPDTCDATTIANAAASFVRDGYAVLPNFSSPNEVAAMRNSMEAFVAAWWREEQATPDSPVAVFTTGKNQSNAQAKSRYFFDSADRVHFFREADNTPPLDGSRPPLNKVGHGLHLDPDSPFGAYARSSRIAAVAREVAGLIAPVLPQSMYIFKEAKLGGAVTSHQDGTFLYTRPQQTVVGLWLALDDAHEGNGCLWARPGSHHEPLRRRFVRKTGEDGEVIMAFEDASADEAEVFLSSQLTNASINVSSSSGTRGAAAEAKPAWWRRVWMWLSRRWGGGSGGDRSQRRRHIERSEAARSWEGVWPPPNTTAGTQAGVKAADELAARGFVPLNVKAGDLVVFPGTLDHLSLPNGSPYARHTFQLHMVEGPAAGVEWGPDNWLQVGGEFMRI